ncbi:MAG TPA: MFS transporter [Streptosporangiaceae bacterium]
MAEQVTDSRHAVSRALAEPTEPVSKRWIGGLGLASLVMWMAALTPANFLIPAQLYGISHSSAKLALGLISAAAAISSLLATPIAGALSDRTTYALPLGHLRGRRHRWTLVFALLGAASLALIGWQSTSLGIGVLWVAFSAFQNGQYASLSAAVPDHVPVNQRATVAGWFSMPQALGLLVGGGLVSFVITGQKSGYLLLAIALFVLTLPFVLFTRDHPLEPEHREPLSARGLLSTFWLSPRQYPEFGWAWLTRFLASLAIALGTLYLLFFLHDVVHYSKLFPGQTDKQGLLILTAIYTLCVVLTAIVGGIISDKIGKRKMIVTISGLLMAAAALLLTFVETWQAAMIAAVLYGAGFGAYLAVDQALITQVLPAATDRAKDLGIINIAIVGPTALAGVLAPVLVHIGRYPMLFAATAVIAIAGSVFVWKIKSVP